MMRRVVGVVVVVKNDANTSRVIIEVNDVAVVEVLVVVVVVVLVAVKNDYDTSCWCCCCCEE